MANVGTIKFFLITSASKMDAESPSHLCTSAQDVTSQQVITSIFTAVRAFLRINNEYCATTE